MAELTVALVGCNAMGQVHLRCWANLIGVRIAAIVDDDGVLAARTAMQVPGAAAFVDLKAALGMGAFDIVDICAPPEQHVALAETAIRAGCHVLCERPLASTPEAARRLVQLAADRERLLLPAFPHRFHGPILFAQELLDNDELGRLSMFRCRFSGYWEEAETERTGDVLMSTAQHGIDLFRGFCGEVASISGKLTTVDPDLPVRDTAALLLEAKGGALGVVECSWSTPGGRNVVELYGTAGACLIDYDAGTLRYLTADQPVWQQQEDNGPNRFERMIAHCADAVRGLQPPVVTGEDAARVLELCAEVYRQNA